MTDNAMSCECFGWERISDDLPPSEHHPRCQHYAPERFVRLTYDGVRCILEPRDAEAVIADGDEPHQYTVEDVWMSREQFDRLPEFEGF